MKNLLLVLFFVVSGLSVNGQVDSPKYKQKLYEDYCNKNSNYAYVYMYITKGGEKQKFYEYLLMDTLFKLIFENEIAKTFRDTTFKKDVLFEYLDNSWDYIKKLREKHNEPNFKKDFIDKEKVIIQIGIRYNDLHFNHFLPKTQQEIDKIKNEDIKKGCLIINAIAKFFEDTFKEK